MDSAILEIHENYEEVQTRDNSQAVAQLLVSAMNTITSAKYATYNFFESIHLDR